jgi:hypothetical protein
MMGRDCHRQPPSIGTTGSNVDVLPRLRRKCLWRRALTGSRFKPPTEGGASHNAPRAGLTKMRCLRAKVAIGALWAGLVVALAFDWGSAGRLTLFVAATAAMSPVGLIGALSKPENASSAPAVSPKRSVFEPN